MAEKQQQQQTPQTTAAAALRVRIIAAKDGKVALAATLVAGKPTETPSPRALAWGTGKLALAVGSDGARLSVDGQPVTIDAGACDVLMRVPPSRAQEVASAVRALLRAGGKDARAEVAVAGDA